ncbi:hypothetical protein MRX96_043791 [Rhipicephalus microplus]
MLVPTLLAYIALRNGRDALAWLIFLWVFVVSGASLLDDGLSTATYTVVIGVVSRTVKGSIVLHLLPVKIPFCCPEGEQVKGGSDVSPTVCVSDGVTATQRPTAFFVADDDPCSLEDGVTVADQMLHRHRIVCWLRALHTDAGFTPVVWDAGTTPP